MKKYEHDIAFLYGTVGWNPRKIAILESRTDKNGVVPNHSM